MSTTPAISERGLLGLRLHAKRLREAEQSNSDIDQRIADLGSAIGVLIREHR